MALSGFLPWKVHVYAIRWGLNPFHEFQIKWSDSKIILPATINSDYKLRIHQKQPYGCWHSISLSLSWWILVQLTLSFVHRNTTRTAMPTHTDAYSISTISVSCSKIKSINKIYCAHDLRHSLYCATYMCVSRCVFFYSFVKSGFGWSRTQLSWFFLWWCIYPKFYTRLFTRFMIRRSTAGWLIW